MAVISDGARVNPTALLTGWILKSGKYGYNSNREEL